MPRQRVTGTGKVKYYSIQVTSPDNKSSQTNHKA